MRERRFGRLSPTYLEASLSDGSLAPMEAGARMENCLQMTADQLRCMRDTGAID